MKMLWCFLFLLHGPVAAESVIRFANQDQLFGDVKSLQGDTLVWESPILEKPTPFFLRDIAEITLSALPPMATANHEATVRLTNGDLIRGQLAAVTPQAVELDTWFAGRISLNRVMVGNLEIRELPKVFYQGPNGMDGWEASGDVPWTYQGNAFISTGPSTISRELRLPEICNVSFTVEWRSSLRLKMVLHAKKESGGGAENTGYEVSFQRNRVQLRKAGEHEWIGHTSAATELRQNEKAQIEVRSNLRTGQFALYVDGRAIDVWTDAEVNRSGLGGGLEFITEDSTPIRLSAIQVTAWDGVVDQLPTPRMNGQLWQEEEEEEAPEKAGSTSEANHIILRNGDSLAGEVVSIMADVITIQTAYGEVKLPVSRLRSVPLGAVSLERAIRRKGDIRGWFSDGTSMVFRLEGAADGMLTGSSQNFGTAHFKLSAFTRLEFNIHQQKGKELWQAGTSP